jgi:hypothetical protein
VNVAAVEVQRTGTLEHEGSQDAGGSIVETFKQSAKLIGEMAIVLAAYTVISRVLVELSQHFTR